MTDKLATWNSFADIDPAFTKPITGKSYKGTSPNPQYVIRCLTELFGPVGKGFGWEVLQEDFTPLGDEILHWCRIRFWTEDRGNSFESYGQTKALMKTRNGLMSDEDAPKKSLTDAIVKAASHIGIAANIFLGRWDDQKYVQSVADDFRDKDDQNADRMSKAAARDTYSKLEADMRQCKSQADLKRWIADTDVKALRQQLPDDWDKNLKQAAADYGRDLPAGDVPSSIANSHQRPLASAEDLRVMHATSENKFQ